MAFIFTTEVDETFSRRLSLLWTLWQWASTAGDVNRKILVEKDYPPGCYGPKAQGEGKGEQQRKLL